MACFRPNVILFDTSVEPKKNLRFLSGNKNGAKLNYEWFNSENEKYRKYGLKREYLQVPCGQCEGCQEAYSKEWAIRCLLESQLYKHNYFLTLTYDEEHLPFADEIIDESTGQIYEDQDGMWPYLGGTLKPEHMEKFLKDLRRHYEYHFQHVGIRAYYCGEYGGQTGRPHYHLIAFNLPIEPEEMKVYRINTDGSTYYTCDRITKLWGRGYVVIGEVNWDTCAYTARYVMKKQKHMSKEAYYEMGKIPEYVRMSTKPGIAREAYKEAYYENDEIIFKGHRETITSAKPSRYFDKLYDLSDHEAMMKIKDRRKELAAAAQRVEMARTSLSINDHLKMKQRIRKDTWNSLKRDKV